MTVLAHYVLSLILAAFPPGKYPEVETRDVGVARLEVVARAQADSAQAFGDRWPEGAADLARADTAAFGWSMGYRRDVQTGEKRGPAGEACFSDMQAPTLRRFAQFETAGLTDAQLHAMVVGLDYASLRRCFDAGNAALVHVRAVAARQCKANVLLGTFALYANGNWCHSPGKGWIERKRLETFMRLRGRREIQWPEWYTLPSEASS